MAVLQMVREIVSMQLPLIVALPLHAKLVHLIW